MPAFVPPLNDERSLLLAYLEQQRNGLRYATFGLTEEQARLTPSVSTLSLGGLVKHVAGVEWFWIQHVIPGTMPDFSTMGDWESFFRLGADETLAAMLEHYRGVAEQTEAAINAIEDLAQPVPVPTSAPWFPKDVQFWSVRWIVLHVIEETARHAGHADIIRESIDGATMYALQAAAEGWPETEYLKPWKPKER